MHQGLLHIHMRFPKEWHFELNLDALRGGENRTRLFPTTLISFLLREIKLRFTFPVLILKLRKESDVSIYTVEIRVADR